MVVNIAFHDKVTEEARNEIGNKNEFKPTNIKWFWWFGIILGLSLLFSVYTTISNNNKINLRVEDIQKKIQYAVSHEQQFNERVVKTFLPESGTAFKYASPMHYNEHIYIGTSEKTGHNNAPVSKMNDNFFYKLDLDLNVVWQYPLQKKMVAGGALMDSNHNLYFVTELLDDKSNVDKKEKIFVKVYLTSLTEDGKFRWEKQISEEAEPWDHGSLTPAISTDDVIYIGQNRFYAFDTEGNYLAQFPSQNDQKIVNYSGSPVIDNIGNVYFTSPEPVKTASTNNVGEQETDIIRAYKFTPKLNSLIWSTVMGNEVLDNEGGNRDGGGGHKARGIESPPALGVGGMSLFGLVGCTISKIDTETGKLLWSLKPDGATGHFNASPAIDNENNLYVGTKSNIESRFFAISSDGKQLWRTDIGSDLYNSPILTGDGMIYVGSETNPEGKFHALERTTGEKKWAIFKDNERKVPDFSHDAMLLYKGYVYVGVHSTDKDDTGGVLNPTFYKIKADAYGYLLNAAWPRIHGGNDNTGRQE